MFTYSCIFLGVVGFHLPNNASECLIESNLEHLQQTKESIKGDFKNQDLRNFSLRGSIVKSSDFTKTLLGVVDPAHTDFYNACFTGAKIDNKDELRGSFPLFNVPGRIDTLIDGQECIDCRTISFSEDIQAQYRSRLDDAIGLFVLAYLYETYGTREQEEEACSLYLKAANKGLVEAYNNIGWMYENKRGTSYKSTETALEYYKKASAHPKGNFNMARLTALSFNDAPTQYALGQLYYNGKGVDPDPESSFYWYMKSAKQHYEAGMFKVGCSLKSGTGVAQSSSEALTWFLRAVSKESQGSQDRLRSYEQLGLLYYYGEGTEKDLEKSFCYRKKAADLGNREILADIAWMYEKGEGVERSLQKALESYQLVVQSTNKIEPLYRQAYIYDLLEDHQQAITFYERAIEQTRARENHEHANALYRLAMKHEKGLGTPINHEKALELFRRAAKVGHILARLKVRLLERASDDVALCDFDDVASMTQEIQLQYAQESKHIFEEVTCDYTITLDLKLSDLCIRHVVGYGENVLHAIKQDYLDARALIREVANERKEDPLQINYEFITCDPYIKYYSTDVTKDILDEDISDQALEIVFLEMHNAVSSALSYTSDIIDTLNILKRKLLEKPQQSLVRKKLVSLYRNWTSDIHDNRLPVPSSEKDPLRYRQGQAAVRFSQHTGCLDGFEEYLESEEAKNVYESSTEIPLGARISKVLNQYKQNFLEKHRNTNTDSREAIEESVEAMRLLKERMRLPLGLFGTFSPLMYPLIGKGSSEVYKPKKVMERFMKGGTIPDRLHSRIEPYTPELLVQLLKKAVLKGEGPLRIDHINLFVAHNKELRMLGEHALDEKEESDYFYPNAEGYDFYKDALLLKLLIDHGYILQRKKNT